MNWSVCLVALLFLAPALAQSDGTGESGDEPPERPEEARNEGGRGEKGNATTSNSSDQPDKGSSAASTSASSHRPEQTTDRQTDQKPAEPRSALGRNVALHFENGTFTYSVDSTTWFDVNLTNATLQKQGHQWKLTSAEGRFVITDTPAGHVSYKGQALNISFQGEVLEHNEQLTALQQGNKSALVSQNDERQSFFSFRVKQTATDRPAVDDAITAGKVAATIRSGTEDEVETYDDVEVIVERPAKATRETPFKVIIGADLEEGRTIVLNLDRTLLQGPDLELRYFDVNDDGTETEVVFRQAESLEDILEPTDDAGQPEYWIVKDDNGVQVMVSIPHWSVHAVTLASIGSFVQPQVWLGAAVGALVSVLAGVAMLRPKREE